MLRRQTKNITLSIFTMVAIAWSNHATAQRLFMLFGHGIYGIPIDKNFNGGYTFGAGVEGGAGMGWNKTFLIGTTGYSSFFHEKGNQSGNVSVIPFKLGLRQYIFLHTIYIHGDLGFAKINYREKDGSNSRFSGDFGAGVKLGAFEVQMDIDGFSRSNPSGFASWIGLKAGFAFGL